jgi:hypothetical protein
MSSYINQSVLEQSLYFSLPYDYNGLFKIYPIKMSQILEYKTYVQSILVRKDSIFPIPQIIQADYLDFLKYVDNNVELEIQYQVPNLHLFYGFFLLLLRLVCQDQEIKFNQNTKEIAIGEITLTGEIVDDIRRIVIAQNDEDFDIDEFLNRETEERLNKAQRDLNKNENPPTIEDRIDSLMVGLHMSNEEISNLTIRKFDRLLKRVITYEEYKTSTLALKTGMVKFKDPIKHWTSPIEVEDRYKNVKSDETALRDKIQ